MALITVAFQFGFMRIAHENAAILLYSPRASTPKIRELVMIAGSPRPVLVLFMLVALFTGSARADDFDALYVGGNFGRAHNTYDTAKNIDSQIIAEAQSAGSTAVFTRRDIRKMSDP